MGYFSTLSLKNGYEDFSYPSPERQLSFRLEDLKNRLIELIEKGAPLRSRYRMSDIDYRYVPPERLNSVYDVKRAIETARHDLSEKYGITEADDDEQADCISFFSLMNMLKSA